jgi:hypothetical protein
MSMETLKKELADVKRDTFEDGTVIRWTASGRYTYAALKTPVGWFTTARAMPDSAQRVPQVVSFDQLLKILAKSETSNVEVATTWEPVG